MTRTYDSSRRAEAAQRTREAILAAAFRLHGQGIFDMESLAQDANVSLATVRKNFPTRELLFESCSEFGMHLVSLPDIALISGILDPAERTRIAVRQAYAFHEQLFGQAWHAFKFEEESPASARVLARIEDLTALIAGLVVEAWPMDEDRLKQTRGFVTAMLNLLTYRALRRYGGLSAEQATEQTTVNLLFFLDDEQRREASAK